MTIIVEDGTGIYEANSYAGLAYAQAYLYRRARNTGWDAAATAAKEAALVAATDYIDKRFGSLFLGCKAFLEIAVAASNYLNFSALPTNGNTITIGSETLTFVSTTPGAGEVEIGASVAATISNLLTALASHPDVDAETAGSVSIIVRNKLTGVQDDILCSVSSAVLFWDYTKLVGGIDSTEQVLEWPRTAAYSRAGTELTGIPEKLRQATVEYASRAIDAKLMPDPVVGDTGQDIRRQLEKVGPIETETAYSAAVKQVFKKYPEADRLLLDLMVSGGGVYR
jgi:hypothetical protein